MKVLIQDSHSKKYWSANGEWVASAEKSADFLSPPRAYAAAANTPAAEFDIVLFFPFTGHSLVVDHGKNKRVKTQ